MVVMRMEEATMGYNRTVYTFRPHRRLASLEPLEAMSSCYSRDYISK